MRLRDYREKYPNQNIKRIKTHSHLIEIHVEKALTARHYLRRTTTHVGSPSLRSIIQPKFEYSLTTCSWRLRSSLDMRHTSGFTNSSTPPTRCSEPVTKTWTGLLQELCKLKVVWNIEMWMHHLFSCDSQNKHVCKGLGAHVVEVEPRLVEESKYFPIL